LNETHNAGDTDLDRLARLTALSWLSPAELGLLASTLALADFKRHELIPYDTDPAAEAHILLTGIVRVTCLNARHTRATVALLAPGPIPEFPPLLLNRFDLRCEAYHDSRVGRLSWSDFEAIATHRPESVFKKLHKNDLRQWYRMLLRSSSFLNLALHERIALTLLELSSDFGIKESRGALLRTSFSHQNIADLVGASRPRVTEHLAQLEREHLIIRQGRQLIVCVEKIGDPTGMPLSSTNDDAFAK
jgi:CRP-like cAMP-binding protein